MACRSKERRPTVADLKPCPFCGSAPELRTSHGWFAVGCGTTMKCPAYIYALTHRSEAEAVATWNKRTPGVATFMAGLETAPKGRGFTGQRPSGVPIAQADWMCASQAEHQGDCTKWCGQTRCLRAPLA